MTHDTPPAAEQSRWDAAARRPLVGAALLVVVVMIGGLLAAQRGQDDQQGAQTVAPPADPLGAIHWTAASAGIPDRPLIADLVPHHGTAGPDGATLVASTGGVLWGIDPRTGDVRWERRLPGETRHPILEVDGAVLVTEPTATSAVRLTALDVDSGLPRWSREVPGDAELAGAGPLALVHDGDELEALEAGTGEHRWRRTVRGGIADVDRGDVLVLADDGAALTALDAADGAERWTEPVSPAIPAVRVRALLADDRVAVVGEGDGTLRGVDRATGETRWRVDARRLGETLEVTPGGLVVLVDRGRAYVAHDVRTGIVAWRADRLVVSPERLHVGASEAVSVTADRQVTGIGLADGATLWQARLAPVGEVAVLGDRAVLSDGDGRLVGVTTADRRPGWETWLPHVGRDVLLPTSDGALVRAATTRANLTVYEPGTGTVRWSQRVGTGASTAPDADDGRLVLRRALGRPHPDYPSGIALTALDETDGTVVWEVPGTDVAVPAWLPSLHPAEVQWLSTIPPVADGDLVVEVAGTAVHAYHADGGADRWEHPDLDGLAAPPALTEELVLVGDSGGTLAALDRRTGDRRWSAELNGPIVSAPRVTGGTVIVTTIDGEVRALDAATGDERWQTSTDTPTRYTPLVTDGSVVVVGRDLVALAAEDGRERWRRRTDAPVAGSPSAGRATVHLTTTDGVVLVLDGADGATVGHFLVTQPLGSGPATIGERTYVLTLRGEIHAIGHRAPELRDWPLPPIDGRSR